jgi:hypothetical protein
VLSNFRNPGIPSMKSRTESKMLKDIPGPGHYRDTTQLSPQGKYADSKFANSLVRSFAKGKRAALVEKDAARVPGPGAYPIFSEFG